MFVIVWPYNVSTLIFVERVVTYRERRFTEQALNSISTLRAVEERTRIF